MYRVEKVEIYNVNGYEVCAKDRVRLDEYLRDVPKKYIKNIDYVGDSNVILVGEDGTNFKCKELRHLKINELFDKKNKALLYADMMNNYVGKEDVCESAG